MRARAVVPRVPKEIIVTHEFPVTADRVFAALDDHANMGRWIGTPVSVVTRMADGGVGTVRRVHAPLMAIDEEVTARDVPHRLVYRIVRGVPFMNYHRGEIRVEPRTDGRSYVRWQVEIESALPAGSSLMLFMVGFALRRGLKRLERVLAN
jgi:uncharacterized protein YndB with AHSA1/START domain